MVMPDEHNPEHEADQPAIYQIRIKGYLSQHRMDWFEGLTVTLEEDGNTLLTGIVIDQAALHGLLKKVRDLAMPLLSVHSVGTTPEDTSGANDQKAGDS
jgi:hypothetical protein